MCMYGAGGVNGDKDRLPSTRWNPSGLKTNCGFCAISYALEQQKGKLVHADELYEQTLQRLGVVRQGNADPIPRMLIFPGLNLDETRIRVEYHELEGRGRGPADYTIWSVAQHAGLELKGGAKDLLNSLVQFGAESKPGWKLDDFIRARMNRSELAGRATFANMKNYVENNLRGNSIIGSIKAQHFVNMAFGSAGEWRVFDAQKGVPYDGRHIKTELGSLDLFERVSTVQ
jgi:hypothetical protein